MAVKHVGEAQTPAERELEAVIARVSEWAGDPVTYRAVGGGITNANFQVMPKSGAQSFFIKIPGKGTEAFIDRVIANQAATFAGSIDLGPRLFRFFEDTGVEISEFVEGFRSCNNIDFQDRATRFKAIDCFKRFNEGKLGQTKTVFEMIDEHVEQTRALAADRPDDHVWLDGQYRLARAAIEAAGLDLTACFNDPMPMNFMLDHAGDRMLLIDYEYASNNDRCYDLGIWFGEMFFSEEVEHELIERYFGRVDPAIVARCQLHKALADIKWGYWSLVQQKQSELDFDFSKYGAWKFMRARSVMHDWRWEAWLRAVVKGSN